MQDYILIDVTRAYWPGVLSYRSQDSARGYRARAEAEARARRVMTDYAARFGQGGPDLRVVRRRPGVEVGCNTPTCPACYE